MDICHLKTAELEPKLQKCRASVKDDSGASAVFTEQGSSASQMTAAKVIGCHCQTTRLRRTSSWCSICLHSKLEDAPRLLKIPKSECPDVWIRTPRHTWPKSWENFEDPVIPLERNLYCRPLAGLLWERQFEEASTELGWEQVTNWECLFVHRTQGLFLSENVGDVKMAGLAPMWKIDEKMWILTNPHHFLTMCTWDTLKIIEQYKNMFESRISAGATEITGMAETSRTNSSVVLRHGGTCSKNASNDTVNWQTRT